MTTHPLGIVGLNHLGIAAKDPEKARHFLNSVLQLDLTHSETVVSQQTITTCFTLPSVPTNLELLEPLDGQGPIARYCENKGGGIHHLALEVADLDAMLEHLKSHQIQLINEEPVDGMGGTRVAFVHPKATGGILVEMVQKP